MSAFEALQRQAQAAIGDDEARDYCVEDIDDAWMCGEIHELQREELIRLLAGITH